MDKTRYPGIYKRTTTQGKTVYDAWASAGGRQKTRRGFVSLAQAKSWLDETLEDMRNDRVGTASSRMTYAEYWRTRWWPHKEANARSNNTREQYGSLGRAIVEALGHRRLGALTALDIQEYLDGLKRRGLSANTINCYKVIISMSLEDARRWKLITRNPCEDVRTPGRQRREVEPLTKDQIDRLLEEADKTRYGMVVYLALVTGMRIGELSALRWDDVNLSPNAGEIAIRKAKTRSGVRRVLLDEYSRERLSAYRLTQVADDQGGGRRLVFSSRWGNPLNESGFSNVWRNIRTAAGLPDLHFHDLRHIHATLLARAGVHPAIAQHRLGHANSGITMDIYTHATASDQSAAVDAVVKWLEGN